MPRPYRARKTRLQLTASVRRWLLHGGDGPAEDPFLPYDHRGRAVWDENRDELLNEWIEAHPGTRPAAWWKYEAPPMSGPKFDRSMRAKVSGSGEESAIVYESDRSRAYFDCDADDPPRLESIAAYLKRHGLLLPGEERRIPARAWKPERLDVDPDGWAPAGAGGWTPEAT